MDKALSNLSIFSRKSTSKAQVVWFGYTTLTYPTIFFLPMVITTCHSGCREIFSLGIPESYTKNKNKHVCMVKLYRTAF
jgi:hypothetical protein